MVMSSWLGNVAAAAVGVPTMTDPTTDGPGVAGRVTVAILTDSRDISAFESEWERLYAYPGNEPSTSFEWTQALLRHRLVADDRFFLLGITRGSETLALLPLVVRSATLLGGRVRALFPIAEIRDTHTRLLARSVDATVASAVVEGLLELPVRWDVFRMSNILENSPLVGHFTSAARGHRLPSLLRETHASYVLDLPASYQHYLAERSAKFRNHLRRVERKLSTEPDIRISEYSTVEEVERGFELLLDVERASWKHLHGTAISSAPKAVGFFRDLCLGAAARGRVHLQVLTISGRPAAYNLGYVRDLTYSYLKTSFDEALKPLGVATYLRARLIGSLVEKGLRVMDFPAAPHEWEKQWTETARWHKKLTMYRATVSGIGLAMAQRLRYRAPRERSVRHVETRNRPQR
jgi:CelD/BcsL family acetyltransferase involved in cellulose biosynthesis